ncbi:FtsX-like permease family protein [Gimibacter soli]|uniref:ABC transporter permease n=1 Tax=Gimibacter soli TaxID=3024400 RepID=A0AAE9XNI7_9PROT|nr:ABC transporter permease [Gimibacter soli]WCL54282.1 ABC transporter permease [Gimibacter soli]
MIALLARLGLKSRPLTLKLIRMLGSMRLQVLAVSLVVTAGTAVHVMMNGVVNSLFITRDTYYAEAMMAHLWAPAVRIPGGIVETLAHHPGVARAEPRIAAAAILDMPGEAAPVKARVISLPEGRQPFINRLHLTGGHLPDAHTDDLVIADEFAEAHGLKPGDTIEAVLYGAKKSFRITGTALSAEFIYAIPPGELIPDPRRFAVFWMPERAVSRAFKMEGAYNEILIRLLPGAMEADVKAAADRLLLPYGGGNTYGRDTQLSNQFIESEFQQLNVTGGIIPPIFMGVAAYLLNIVVSRITDQERGQIGLMKAFGYTDAAIARHYLIFAYAMVALGVAAGFIVGTRMGGGLAEIYRAYYQFPSLEFTAGLPVYLQGLGLAFLAATVGVFIAMRRVIALRPAVAMAPPAPTDYSHLRLDSPLFAKLDQGLRLILRHLVRWPVRSALTCLGIALGMTIMVAAHSMFDGVNFMMQLQFQSLNRQDVTVGFIEDQGEGIVHEMAALPGVQRVEPFYAAPAILKAGTYERALSLTGRWPDTKLSLMENEAGEAVPVPPYGLAISESLSERLQVGVGDTIHVEFRTGARKRVDLPVVHIFTTYIGLSALIDHDELASLTGLGPRVSGVHLEVDPARMDDLYAALKKAPKVAAVTSNANAYKVMRAMMDENLNTMNLFNTAFASLIAFGVVFSSARISFAERVREIATLRVLGFSRGDVNLVLLGELGILIFLALPLGGFMGRQLAGMLATEMSSELFRVPEVTAPWTYGYATLIIVIAAAISGWMVMKQVRTLDLVSALKYSD